MLLFISPVPQDGRRIQEILEVFGYENGQYITKTL